MKTLWAALLALLLGAGAGGMWLFQHNAKVTAELQIKADQQDATITQLQQDNKRLDALFTDKLRGDTAIRNKRAANAQSFEVLRREDQTVRTWADEPIPLRVRNLDQAGPAAGSSAGAH